MRYLLGSELDPQELARLASAALHEGNRIEPLGEVERLYVDSGDLVVWFSGDSPEPLGPFAARLPLPVTVGDDEWQAYTESNEPSQWIAHAVVIRLFEAYETLDESMWQRESSGRFVLQFPRSEAPSNVARAAWLREFAAQTGERS